MDGYHRFAAAELSVFCATTESVCFFFNLQFTPVIVAVMLLLSYDYNNYFLLLPKTPFVDS